MKDTGTALMGIGEGTGESAAADAAREAVTSPLLETSIEGAHGVLLNFTGSMDKLSIYDVNEAAAEIEEMVHTDANIIFGAAFDDTLGDTVRVTVIATGFDMEGEKIGVEPQQNKEADQQGNQTQEQPAQQPQPMAPFGGNFDSLTIPDWLRHS